MPRKKKVEKPTHLSNEDMLKIDIGNIESELNEVKKNNLLLKKELIIIRLDKQIEEASLIAEKSKLKRMKLNSEIKERFEIESDKWGYDPLTGEIKL